MPNSYQALVFHIIFAVKNRAPLITPEIESRVWSYMGGVVKSNGCVPLRIGGIENHVHLLISGSSDLSVSELVKRTKTTATRWIRANFPDLSEFAWQDGYAAFSVSPSSIDAVSRYIDRQREHHTKKSFEDEYRAFLVAHDIDHEERSLF